MQLKCFIYLLLIYFNLFFANYCEGNYQTVSEMQHYLSQFDYQIDSLEKVSTMGATDCTYFILSTNQGKHYFVKCGEKVDLEVANYQFLLAKGIHAISAIYPGTSSENKILIIEFADHAAFGAQVVEDFHEQRLTAQDLMLFQQKVCQAAAEIYRLEEDANLVNSCQLLEKRAQERLVQLLEDQDTKEIVSQQVENSKNNRLISFLTFPIIYKQNEKIQEIISIEQMVQVFCEKMAQVPALKFNRILHGDFHAPNISQDLQGNIKLIDLSDVKYHEDIAWDLGKWLNYINRFYRVAKLRSNDTPDQDTRIDIKEKTLYITTNLLINHQLKRINQAMIEQFAELSCEEPSLLKLRAQAAEFVVNLSTLKRHFLYHPQTVNLILSCIVETYLNFVEGWNDYQTQNSSSY